MYFDPIFILDPEVEVHDFYVDFSPEWTDLVLMLVMFRDREGMLTGKMYSNASNPPVAFDLHVNFIISWTLVDENYVFVHCGDVCFSLVETKLLNLVSKPCISPSVRQSDYCSDYMIAIYWELWVETVSVWILADCTACDPGSCVIRDRDIQTVLLLCKRTVPLVSHNPNERLKFIVTLYINRS